MSKRDKDIEELKEKVKKLEDTQDETNLLIRYLIYDLEATKRELEGK
jgi:hypothetical protein